MTRLANSFLPHLIIVGLLCMVTYANALRAPFILDDREVIVENPITQDLHYFLKPWEAKQYRGNFLYQSFKMRYITFLTFACNFAMHGLNTTGYHVVNILCHMLTAWAVYCFVMMLLSTPVLRGSSLATKAPAVSFIVATIFAVHPIQTAAVNYTWQRTTILCALFYVWSIVCYGYARLSWLSTSSAQSKKAKFLYAAALIFCLIASRTKENAVTLPCSILALEFILFGQGEIKKRLLYVLPFFLVMANVGLSLIEGPDVELTPLDSSTMQQEPYGRSEYLYSQFKVVAIYLSLLILPYGQRLIYDIASYKTLWNPAVFALLLTHFTLLGGALFLLSRSLRQQIAIEWGLVGIGVCWFYGTIAIESSLLVLSDLAFEHRVYLPSIGAIIAIVTTTTTLCGTNTKRFRGIPFFLALTTVIVLSVLTIKRNAVWATEDGIWQDCLRKSPSSVMVHYEIGMSFAKKERYEEAIPFFKKASLLESESNGKGWNSPALNNLGNCYYVLGRLSEAEQTWQSAYQKNPDNIVALYNIGMVEDRLGDYDMAVKYYKEFLRRSPPPLPQQVVSRVRDLETKQ